jgi:branched-chain amino acid transport system permease protein
MDFLIGQILSGLTSGLLYGSLALALVMIHRATGHVNFAQGEMATFSTFIAWSLLQRGWPYWAAFAATVGLSFIGGVAIQRLVIRRVAGASALAHVVVFIGLAILLNSIAGWIYGYEIKGFPSPFPQDAAYATQGLSAHEAGSAGVLLCTMGLLSAFFRFTRTGLAIRGAAQAPDSARLAGVRVSWMLALAWGIAAAIGAVAGMMAAPALFLEPNMMGSVLLYAFAAALLGGIDHPVGAVVGGLLIGVLENMLGAYVIDGELKSCAALAIIVGTLVLRPDGLFGRAAAIRA